MVSPPVPISFSGTGSGGHGDAPLHQSNNSNTGTNNSAESPNGCDSDSDPIDIGSGTKLETYVDFSVPGEMGLSYVRYYRSNGGWSNNFAYSLDIDCGGQDQCYQTTVHRPDGTAMTFRGGPASTGDKPEIGGGGLATLTHNVDGSYTLHDEDTTTKEFDAYGRLISIEDASGIGWALTYSYDYSTGVSTVRVTHTNGQYITIASQNVFTNGVWTSVNVTVTDPAGNVYGYTEMPSTLFVMTATLPGSPSTVISYKYNTFYQLTEVDYNGTPYSFTSYGTGGAAGSHLADGSENTSIIYNAYSGGMTATITNPLGHSKTKKYVTSYGADGQAYNQLQSVSDDAVSDCGATIHARYYDANGNLSKTVDNNLITHTYYYADNGQLQTETEAYGTSVARTTDYQWDPNQQLNRLMSVTVEGETRVDYTYNAQNRIASITRTNLSANGISNQALKTTYDYTYYGSGMVKTMTVTSPSPGGTNAVTTTYNSLGWPLSIADGLGHTTIYSNYNALGEPLQVTGPNGAVTGYTYDERGRVQTKTIHSSAGAGRWSYYYDGFGLLYQVVAPGSDTTTWNRDAEMRVRTITHNDSTGASTETLGYDANGDINSDVIARGDDIGKSSTALYDGLGRVYQRKGANGQVWTYAYDGNGNVLSVADALSHTTHYHYDALNRLSETINARNGTTYYYYDAGDHLTKVIDPRGLVTTYTWDGLGLLWKQVSPDTGATSFNYDGYGRLASKTRADGVQSLYGYDAINRLAKLTTSDGLNQTWTYDTCTNGKGLLCSAAGTSTSVAYSYTPEGWLASRDFVVDGTLYSLDYAYDNAGRLATVEYPDGNQANYDYTTGTVSSLSLTVNGTVMDGVTSIAYRPMNLAMTAWNSANGLRNVDAYDEDMRLMGIRVPNLQSWDYGYDTANRLKTMTDNLDGTLTQTLSYDELDRLNTVISTADNENYTYDANGNRLTQAVNGVSTTLTIDSASNRLIGETSSGSTTNYKYDLQGNLYGYGPGTPSQMFYYNGADRLWQTNIAGTQTIYEVDPEGQRLRKYTSTDSTLFAPDVSGTLMAENQDGTWADYVWLNGKLVAMIRKGNVYSVHTDQTGRPEGMTNSQGTVVWRAHNYAFDREITAGQASGFNLGFPGQYFDSEDGLYYNGYRDYDATLGRYIESDPTGLLGGVNTYAYVGNNPITGVDPLGLCKCTKAQQIAAQIASAFQDQGEAAQKTAGLFATGTLISAGLELPSGGTDSPFTGAFAGLTLRAGAIAVFDDLVSGGLNTLAAGGDPRYFLRSVASGAAGSALEHLGGWGSIASATKDELGNIAGQDVEAILNLPPPCH